MPIPPGLSPKDADQVIRAVMDDTNNRLRVDAVISPDGSDVSIHYSDDSIAIGDPDSDNILAINADGSINTAIVGEVAIEISAADGDNIAISDGTDTLEVNPDGSINVALVDEITTSNTFDEVTGVASGVSTPIVTYTALSDVRLQSVAFSGTNIAMYEIFIDASLQDKYYTFYGNLNGAVNFQDGLDLMSGQVVTVQVTHFRPTLGDFNGRIQVVA